MENNLDPDKLARELARVQQEVTGLTDDQLGTTLESGEGNAGSTELNRKLASARKVIQLLDKMRPQASDAGNTAVDFDTARSIAASEPTRQDAASESDSSMLQGEIPESIGRFEIQSLLGVGGFGLVFRAHDPELGRGVALKVPTLDSLLKADSLARFQQESRAVARLSHPNIVPVFEIGNDGPISYIASAYVPGTDLARWVAKHGVLRPRHAAEVVAVIADAIQHAHRRNIVHRDLKPANVLVQLDPLEEASTFDPQSVHIADFGLAKTLGAPHGPLTQTGSVLGTPAFAAPEQLSADFNGPRPSQEEIVDVYSIGAILYFLLTGQPPHQAENLLDLIQQVKNRDPIPPANVPVELNAICMKAMEKLPSDRYASAYELERDLQNFLDGKPIIARPVGALGRAHRWCRRNPIVATLLLITLAAILLGTVASVWSTRNANIAAAKARQQYLDSKRVIDQYYVQVTRDPMYLSPSFREQKQQLLEAAKRHYVEFLRLNSGDEDLAIDLVRTEIYLANAEMEGENLTEAREGFSKSLASIDERLKNSPTSTELKLLRCFCQRGIGAIDVKTGDTKNVLPRLEYAADTLESLFHENPRDQEIAFELIQAYQTLIHFHRGQGESKKVNDYAVEQQMLLESLASVTQLNSTLQNHYAMSLGERSMFSRDSGKLDESADLLNQSIEISEELISNEPNPIWFAEVAAGSLYRRSVVYVRSGKSTLAMADAKRCLELCNAVSLHNRTAELASLQSGARSVLAVCLKTMSRNLEALELTAQNLVDARKLAKSNPEKIDLQRNLAITMIQLEGALVDEMQLESGESLRLELIELLTQLKLRGTKHPLFADLGIAVKIEKGRILHRQEKFDQAIAAFDDAVEHLDQIKDSMPMQRRSIQLKPIYENRSLTFLAMGQIEDAIADRRLALKFGPADSFQNLSMAEALARAGEINESKQWLQKESDKQKELATRGSQMLMAFVHGAIAIELKKQWDVDPENGELEAEFNAELELAEKHFLRAVDLGYFEKRPINFFAIHLRSHLNSLYKLPSISPIIRRQRTLWENRNVQ